MDCVPWTIHQLAGVPYEEAIVAARRWGFDDNGMTTLGGWYLAKHLGLQVSKMRVLRDRRLTLGKFLPTLESTRRLVISVKDHVLGFDRGAVLDRAGNTPGRLMVHGYFEVLN